MSSARQYLEHHTYDGSEHRCPFCGGAFIFDEVEDKLRAGHSVPSCDTFQRLDPDEFLIAAMNEVKKGRAQA